MKTIDIEREAYLESWSSFMLQIWMEKMQQEMVGISQRADGSTRRSTGELMRSLETHVTKESGGSSAKIDHFFNNYGMYLDGGVFPGTKGSGGQNRVSNPNRVPKPWRGLKYWYSKMRLQEKMMELTGKDYLMSIHTILTSKK